MRFAVTIDSRDDDPPRDYLAQNYVRYLAELGIWPVLVPNHLPGHDPRPFLAALEVEGLVLTGGSDLDPARYGQPNTHSRRIVPPRDRTELLALDYAAAHDLPVIGICRGIQTINVFFGGGLVQDIPAQLRSPIDHDSDDQPHPVTITDARIAHVVSGDWLEVNSHHHQAITRDLLAPDLDAFAICEADGVIEGVIHRHRPVIGAQWHPERPTPSRDCDLRLFRRFLREGAFWVA
jgi:putative glutamine amidotransferase